MLQPLLTRHYHEKYRSQIDILVEILASRLLPTFPESEATVQKEIEQLQVDLPSEVTVDSVTAYESLLEYQYGKLDLLEGMRQALINMFAISLYHLFEQQLLDCQTSVLGRPIRRMGSDILTEWSTRFTHISLTPTVKDRIDELNLLCNTLKHGNGSSANKLHNRWPRLFQGPWERDFLSSNDAICHVPHLKIPIFGDEVYVELEDIHRYQDALKVFWETYLPAFTYKK